MKLLNLIPVDFWKTSKIIKIFILNNNPELILTIYNKLIKYSFLTKQEILMECLYFNNINLLTSRLIDPNDEYILNIGVKPIDIDAVIGVSNYTIKKSNNIIEFDKLKNIIPKNTIKSYLLYKHPDYNTFKPSINNITIFFNYRCHNISIYHNEKRQ